MPCIPARVVNIAPTLAVRKVIVFIGDIKKRKFSESYFNLVEVKKFVRVDEGSAEHKEVLLFEHGF